MAVNKNFVVKNGLEVDTNLIVANADTNRVGIGTTIPQYTLHVFEGTGIGATNVFVTGITTVIDELRVGTGGTIFSVIAGPTGFGQSVGVGTSRPAFLLDVHSPVSTGQTALRVRGDGRITGNLVIGSGVTLGTLHVTGISTFVGFSTFEDYVFIQDGLNVTGTGATLSSLHVTGISTFVGFSTFEDYVFIQDGLNVTGAGATLSSLHVTGISTFVGFSTFQDYVFIQDGLNVTGAGATLSSLHVLGVSTFVGFSTFNDYVFIQDGLNVTGAGATLSSLHVTGISTFVGFSTFNDYVFIQDGLNVTGAGATLSSLNVTGVSTFVGLSTFNDYVFIQDGLNVTGAGATLSSLHVTGISTFVGFSTFQDYVFIQDGLNVTGAGATIGTVKISSGIITATSGVVTYYGDGQYLNLTDNPSTGIGIGTTGGVVGYGITFLDLQGPGLSTVFYNNTVGIATIFFQGGGGGDASIGIGTTPGEAFTGIITAGNLWYNSGLGRLFIYYQDDDSVQWVDASPSNVGIITSLTNVSFSAGSATAPSMHFVGDSQTGFFSPGAGQITFVSVGSSILNINPSGINVTGVVTATDFNSLSDANYKENVATVDSALTKVDQLRGVKFDWKESGLPSYGVIAQELQEVLPELVHGNDPKTVNYNGIVGVLIEAIKELKAEVEELKSIINK